MMEKIKTSVTIEAPSYQGNSRYYINAGDQYTAEHQETVATETMSSFGHRCNKCQGMGYYWSVDKFNEDYKAPCPMCGGTGMLDAVIKIEWKKQNK